VRQKKSPAASGKEASRAVECNYSAFKSNAFAADLQHLRAAIIASRFRLSPGHAAAVAALAFQDSTQ
jgi:hypothetical protein